MFPYDHVLLAAVQKRPQSVADVLQTMEAIGTACVDGDGLKWFNWLYHRVTQAVEARIAAGGFADPVWLAQLDVQFAGLYFGALESALRGQPSPGCWQALFECRNCAAIARIQFALAGINAHINHDLPQAIDATCDVTKTAPARDGQRYNDYTTLNPTLDRIIGAAKQELRVRLLGDALPAASRLEDTLAAWSVSAAREAAWRNAEIFWNLRPAPALTSNLMDTLDGLTTLASKTLLVPVPGWNGPAQSV
ncbi:MAG TPA: DUF5995 family protein [Bryobacteraceae bacterium]|jgi:hypothetical protein|nr:DUF5995 family protein [Bryobacteraceae bacterium]